MNNTENKKNNKVFSLIAFVFLILLFIKVSGKADLSWWLVWSPVLFFPVVFILFFVCGYIIKHVFIEENKENNTNTD